MSKWGMEEIETLNAIDRVNFSGKILNVAVGDGRFNNKLLELADTVMAIDIDKDELDSLKSNCPSHLKDKLNTKCMDITQRFPFKDNAFDGVFCTGTLHLFQEDVMIKILQEIKRVLKPNGKIVLDFATDIERLDKSGKKVTFEEEGCYHIEEAIQLFQNQLSEFSANIEVSEFSEENLEENAGYHSINGKFLVVSGRKK